MDSQILTAALIKKNLLTKEAGEQVLKESAVSQKPVEDLLYMRRTIPEEKIAEVKSEITGIPYQKIDIKVLTDDLLALVPKETVQTYKVAPLSRTKDMLVVGMVDPQDSRAQDALRFIAKANRLNLGVYVITPSDLELVLRKYNPYKSEVEAAIRSLGMKPGEGLSPLQRPVALEESRGVAEEAPIIKLVASTFREAVERKASDIHVEPMRNRVRVRFRIDGDLEEAASFPIELQQPLVSRIKILSDLKIDETRIPQDGRFRTVIFGRDIDFRVATFPTPMGEKVALRVLDPSIGLKGIDNLGIVGKNADIIKEGIEKPFGMVLVTGPTGSGKTTTLYALLKILNQENVNIVSLEDPVEYFVEGINQSQVKPEIGYDFASGLRQILRQDPDIIMVGEIRDNETAGLAVNAALTGHIVLSTLHTNNAAGVIPRLIDMEVPPFLLPSALNLMMSQRLLGRLCQQCRQTEAASPEIQKIIKEEIAKLPEEVRLKLVYKEPYQIFHSPGCPACKNKGTSGRIAIFEIMRMTRELEKIIAEHPTEAAIIDEGARQGMITLRQDGILKALDGVVSMEEVLRETE
ncbi:MAG: Flp pilus assembly complex ATPase component TadA [Patescibacteria group bacterium]|nr:Flp pilus assembly complex ATPase component TadA [Patescibacteria group bacterium]MCL5262074.1 Flp pilus assembly complex ATPase component TadA [Patescibacteria group bacterium]